MNPSLAGWIKKLLKEIEKNNRFLEQDTVSFYKALRSCGFIYGSNINVVSEVVPKKDFTQSELCKTNLCLALYYTHTKCESQVPFIDSVIEFYSDINPIKNSFFQDLLGENKSSDQLEKIIHKRIQIDANVLTKNFNYFIINALLYVDILAYKAYLKQDNISTEYLKKMEASIASISLDVLNSKEEKNQYDESVIKLFESSLRYQQNVQLDYKRAIKNVNTNLETVNQFYTINKDSIALLSSKNIAQSFYNNSSKMVNKLITRNSKRLYQELLDSKELMVLLSQSTIRDLNKEEQKKVQEQLLDIFKSIPSLAIFLLPGGALLLPLVVKFIPKLLPSAFDENRIDE